MKQKEKDHEDFLKDDETKSEPVTSQ
jgi:hypothetical protein